MNPEPLSPPIKVQYKPLPIQPSSYWPILDIKLAHDGKITPQPILSLIDSGANGSILHIELAELLGFKLKNLGRATKGGTSVSGNYNSWTLPEPIDTTIFGLTVPVHFRVIDNRSLIWPCILGEDSIFQIAKLDFTKFKGFFEIRFRRDIN